MLNFSQLQSELVCNNHALISKTKFATPHELLDFHVYGDGTIEQLILHHKEKAIILNVEYSHRISYNWTGQKDRKEYKYIDIHIYHQYIPYKDILKKTYNREKANSFFNDDDNYDLIVPGYGHLYPALPIKKGWRNFSQWGIYKVESETTLYRAFPAIDELLEIINEVETLLLPWLNKSFDKKESHFLDSHCFIPQYIFKDKGKKDSRDFDNTNNIKKLFFEQFDSRYYRSVFV